MTNKTLTAALLLGFSTQLLADDQAISLLHEKVETRVQHLTEITHNMVIPDAIEIHDIKMKLIASEISETGIDIEDIVTKYRLDDSQKRQVVIIVYTSGDGVEPLTSGDGVEPNTNGDGVEPK
jgi:hypothetical protein